jgi:cellobiose-specific phosphotransferase system component IIC
MLQNQVFSRSSAFIGILAFALSLADYIRQALTQSLIIALPLILLGALFLFIWFVLIGLKLLQLGHHEEETQSAG